MRRLALLAFVLAASLLPGRCKDYAPAATDSPGRTAAAVAGAALGVPLIQAMPGSRNYSTGRSVGAAVSWLLIVAVVGFILMALSPEKLRVVVDTLQGGVAKSLGMGLLGHLAIVPGAIAVALLLAVTLIGILIIPVGMVAFFLAVGALATFGFVAVAVMTGSALTSRRSDATANGAMLRSFLVGTAVYLGLWVLVAALGGIPLLGPMLYSFASGVTFIAMTAGLGAVLLAWWRGAFRKTAATQ